VAHLTGGGIMPLLEMDVEDLFDWLDTCKHVFPKR